MQVDLRLFFDIALTITIGWFGGLLARAAHLPLVVGYIVAGVLIGPHSPGPVVSNASVEVLATLGVVFLLFALGVQFSLGGLLQVWRVGIIGGSVQVLLIVAAGIGAGWLLGWNSSASIILGFALAVTSTTVLVKVLGERGEAHTQYAAVALGISITQDLMTVAMVSVLPALDTLSPRVLPEIGLLLARAIGFVAVVLILARTVVPWVLTRISRTGSRELFLGAAVAICLLGAGAAQWLGLSLALGAFLAGLMISESEFHYETYSIVAPLRDAFALVFFVSLGMLFNPMVLVQEWQAILVVLAVLLFIKAPLVTGIVLASGYHLRTAIMAGLILVPVSEYSFIIALLAAAPPLLYLAGVQYGIIIAAAVISIVVTPLLVAVGGPLYQQAIRVRPLRRLTRAARENAELAQARRQRDYVLICGYGRVGQMVGEALRSFHVPVVVIDYNQHVVAALRRDDVFALYGDASSPVLQQQAGVKHAAMAVICLPDARSAMLTLRNLKRDNAELPVIVRGLSPADLREGYAGGAEEVVEAEFECGLELARHTLMRLGLDQTIVQHHVDQVRLFRYRSEMDADSAREG